MSKLTISLQDKNDGKKGPISISLPKECPWCHLYITPVINGNSVIDRINNPNLPFSLILECPTCYQHFIQSYKVEFGQHGGILELSQVDEKPMPKSLFKYPEEVDRISTEFKEIIIQSSHAEDLNFNHLAGIGYRKAIEFLIKDYLIEIKEFDKIEISKQLLGQCISKIEDSRIQSLSKAATWIGNDETHYIRKHKDKDLKDLKKFLHTLTALVSYEINITEAENFINGN